MPYLFPAVDTNIRSIGSSQAGSDSPARRRGFLLQARAHAVVPTDQKTIAMASGVSRFLSLFTFFVHTNHISIRNRFAHNAVPDNCVKNFVVWLFLRDRKSVC